MNELSRKIPASFVKRFRQNSILYKFEVSSLKVEPVVNENTLLTKENYYSREVEDFFSDNIETHFGRLENAIKKYLENNCAKNTQNLHNCIEPIRKAMEIQFYRSKKVL